MSDSQSYDAVSAANPDSVADFGDDHSSVIKRIQHVLHVTPSLLPLIVLVLSVIIFGALLGSKFFSPS